MANGGISVVPGISLPTHISGSPLGISNGTGISPTPPPTTSYLTTDDGSSVLTDDSGTDRLTPG